MDDLLDFESIELLDEDFNDIVSIRKLSDSTADKLTFTIFLSNVMLTAFLAGYIPQYFYYWHSLVRNETVHVCMQPCCVCVENYCVGTVNFRAFCTKLFAPFITCCFAAFLFSKVMVVPKHKIYASFTGNILL